MCLGSFSMHHNLEATTYASTDSIALVCIDSSINNNRWMTMLGSPRNSPCKLTCMAATRNYYKGLKCKELDDEN